mmetsp:Transcript_25847/g.76401  ORF Transcript_25847/g.76401 Transcript_25847/m.76401 type:complete len:380 (+) Transcript_25847:7285-8424(+)
MMDDIVPRKSPRIGRRRLGFLLGETPGEFGAQLEESGQGNILRMHRRDGNSANLQNHGLLLRRRLRILVDRRYGERRTRRNGRGRVQIRPGARPVVRAVHGTLITECRYGHVVPRGDGLIIAPAHRSGASLSPAEAGERHAPAAFPASAVRAFAAAAATGGQNGPARALLFRLLLEDRLERFQNQRPRFECYLPPGGELRVTSPSSHARRREEARRGAIAATPLAFVSSPVGASVTAATAALFLAHVQRLRCRLGEILELHVVQSVLDEAWDAGIGGERQEAARELLGASGAPVQGPVLRVFVILGIGLVVFPPVGGVRTFSLEVNGDLLLRYPLLPLALAPNMHIVHRKHCHQPSSTASMASIGTFVSRTVSPIAPSQ